MNIEEKILYCVFFYNRILIVVPLYVLGFSQIVLTYLLLFLKRKISIIFAHIFQRFSSILVEIKNKVIFSCLT